MDKSFENYSQSPKPHYADQDADDVSNNKQMYDKQSEFHEAQMW